MRNRFKPSSSVLSLVVVIGVAGVSLAGLWNKVELEHARTVEKDRKARINTNKAGLTLVKDADIRRLTEAKIACYERSLELIERYRKVIEADDLVQAKKLREALHLLRLQGESYNEAIELYTTANGYKLAQKKVQEALIATLRSTAKGLEGQAQAYDAGISALTE